MKTLPSLSLIAAYFILQGCATIAGGSKYFAHVTVKDHPNATIEYKGIEQGTGSATFKVPRAKANKFSVTVKEDGYEEQTFSFKKHAFRGWAFAGTFITWTGLIGNVPIPWGVAVDFATGALWKPSKKEKGVQQIDYKNFKYVLDYEGIPSSASK